MMATAMDWLLLLLTASIKGSVILIAALVALRFMKRASAAARHAIIAIALGAFLVFPAMQIVAPRWSLAVMPAQSGEAVSRFGDAWRAALADEALVPRADGEVSSSMAAEHVRDGDAHRDLVHEPEEAAPIASADSPTGPTWRRVLLFAWVLGTSLIALRLLAGVAAVWLLERRAIMITDGSWLQTAHALAQRLGLTRGVTLLRGHRGSVPLTWGVLQPVVWLPADATEWDSERRSVVLAHELAHVKRRDAVTQWIANVVLAFHWFNPLAWLAARQLRAERERACDDAVLSLGTQPTVYAEHLLAMVRSIGDGGGPAAAMAMARRSQFEGRLLAILEGTGARRGLGSMRIAALLACALIIAVPLAGMTPATRASAAAMDVPGIASEAGGYPAALSVESDARGASPLGSAPTSSSRTGEEWEGTRPAPVRLPPSNASARGAATAVLADPAEASRMLNRAVAQNDSALLLSIIAATIEMSSSSDRALVLSRIASIPSLPQDVVRGLLAAVQPIPSSGAKATVLGALQRHQPGMFAHSGPQFVEAVNTIASSTSRTSLLMPMLSVPNQDPRATVAALRATAGITSGTDRAHLIGAAIRNQPVALTSAAPLTFALIDSLASSTDRSALLMQIVRREKVPDDILIRVMQSTRSLSSSTDKAHVLVAIAGRGTPTGSVKTAFLETTSTLSSSSDRAYVLSMLLPQEGESNTAAPARRPRSSLHSAEIQRGVIRLGERSWYVTSDTTAGVARRLSVMWQGVELRNGEMLNRNPRGRVEIEERTERLASGTPPVVRRVIVTFDEENPDYDYCIDEVVQPFDARARAWVTSTLRAAEQAHR